MDKGGLYNPNNFDNLRKNVLAATIITYDLASSSTKSSSSLLSSTSKIPTPPFAKGIVVVEDTDSAGIAIEDIVVVYTALDDTEAALVQLAFAHHFSLSRYPSFFLTVVEVLYNLSHHDLLIYKIYNTN